MSDDKTEGQRAMDSLADAMTAYETSLLTRITELEAECDSIRDEALEKAAVKLKASCTTCWGTSGDHGCNVCGKPMEIIRALKGGKP